MCAYSPHVYEIEESAGIIMAGRMSDKDQCCRSPGETGLVWSPSSMSQDLCLDFTCWVICHFTFLYPFPHTFLALGVHVTLWQPGPPHPPHQNEFRNPFSMLLCHPAWVSRTRCCLCCASPRLAVLRLYLVFCSSLQPWYLKHYKLLGN